MPRRTLRLRWTVAVLMVASAPYESSSGSNSSKPNIGRELAVPNHLSEEAAQPIPDLLKHGAQLFSANWTDQEGAGRPLSKGTGRQLTDPSQPLVGKRPFNRVSAPDANPHRLPQHALWYSGRRRRFR